MPQGAQDVDQSRLLRTRRESIEAICSELGDVGRVMPPERVTQMVMSGLCHGEFGFLDTLPGGRAGLAEQAAQEYARFAPSRASNAASPVSLVRILLLQSLDLAWWGDVPDYLDDKAVEWAPGLIDLIELRRAGGVVFGFGVASDALLHRGRDFLFQRLWPDREPRGPGLPFLRARPAMVGMLNEIATITSRKAPSGSPSMWVNSIVRSVEHQRKLARLGFSAPLPSAHCRGWAADIELAWFERFGAADTLREVLLAQLDEGVLNVIDEGRAWHVCLAPDHVARFESIFPTTF